MASPTHDDGVVDVAKRSRQRSADTGPPSKASRRRSRSRSKDRSSRSRRSPISQSSSRRERSRSERSQRSRSTEHRRSRSRSRRRSRSRSKDRSSRSRRSPISQSSSRRERSRSERSQRSRSTEHRRSRSRSRRRSRSRSKDRSSRSRRSPISQSSSRRERSRSERSQRSRSTEHRRSRSRSRRRSRSRSKDRSSRSRRSPISQSSSRRERSRSERSQRSRSTEHRRSRSRSSAATGGGREVADQGSIAMTLIVTGTDVNIKKQSVLSSRNGHHRLAVLITEADGGIIDQFMRTNHHEQATQLCIDECEKITSQCLTRLLAAFKRLEDVTIGRKLSDAINEESLAALHGCSHLQKVQLGAIKKTFVNIADTTVKALSRLVVECRQLWELKLFAKEETSLRVLRSLLEHEEEIQNADGTPRTVTLRLTKTSHDFVKKKEPSLTTKIIVVKNMTED
ncbi:arginine/serine-rich coiled-coil protein 2-like [Amphibalanus amphitrite]|uniref:arginine/serine-rich coiled-coil protein 2-like n=1 Tax=Amphibalanus amphitrite TaxID=1232801 RepID=UPI001C913CB1|nr:arginine/serine-rich coiled-coil protein 2-like [Amphibalanus amphitrite]